MTEMEQEECLHCLVINAMSDAVEEDRYTPHDAVLAIADALADIIGSCDDVETRQNMLKNVLIRLPVMVTQATMANQSNVLEEGHA